MAASIDELFAAEGGGFQCWQVGRRIQRHNIISSENSRAGYFCGSQYEGARLCTLGRTLGRTRLASTTPHSDRSSAHGGPQQRRKEAVHADVLLGRSLGRAAGRSLGSAIVSDVEGCPWGPSIAPLLGSTKRRSASLQRCNGSPVTMGSAARSIIQQATAPFGCRVLADPALPCIVHRTGNS